MGRVAVGISWCPLADPAGLEILTALQGPGWPVLCVCCLPLLSFRRTAIMTVLAGVTALGWDGIARLEGRVVFQK